MKLHGRSCFIVLAILTASCEHTPSYVDLGKGEDAESYDPIRPVVFQVFPAFHEHPPECVAVLPFTFTIDPTRRDDADIVRRSVFGHLAAQGKRLVELPRVDFVLASLSPLERSTPSIVSQRLNCDTLLSGDVTEYARLFFGVYSWTGVGANLRLIRATEKGVLWEGSHVAVSHGGSFGLTPIGWGLGILGAATNIRAEQLLRLADDLGRRLISTIPVTPVTVQDQPLAAVAVVAPPPVAAVNPAEEARRLVAAGDYSGALGEVDRALKANPNDHATHFLKGRILTRLGDLNGAEKSMIRAVALNDGDADYYNGIGYVASLRSDDERAAAAYRMAIGHDAANAFAHYNLGVTYLKTGADAKAADAFVHAGTAYFDRGDYANASKVVANLKELASQGGLKLEEPIATLERALDSVAKKGLPPHV